MNEFSPLSETAYYILLALKIERHGYGIIQHVEQITNNRISLGAGTIYGTLRKMEKSNLIKPTKEEDKRKYYIITQLGEMVLKEEIQRIGEMYHNGMEEYTC